MCSSTTQIPFKREAPKKAFLETFSQDMIPFSKRKIGYIVIWNSNLKNASWCSQAFSLTSYPKGNHN